MTDIKKIIIDSLGLSKDMTLDPVDTATRYNESLPTWKDTFFKSYVPIVLIAVFSSFILSLAVNTYGFSFAGFGYLLESTVYQMIFGLLSLIVFAAIFSFLAKYFDGQVNFDAAVATLVLSSLPYVLASSLLPIQMIGWILAILTFFYTLYILYQITPIMMKVPSEKRIPYLVVTFVACIIVTLPISMLFYNMSVPLSMTYNQDVEVSESDSSRQYEAYPANVFGNLLLDQKYVQAAQDDRYSPPDNGKVSEKQVKKLVSVNKKTSEMQNKIMERFEKYNDRADIDDLSWSEKLELGKQGMAMGTMEMRVVKSGNGNWAEHQWVKEQLQKSVIHHQSNPIAAHNYRLYKKYEDGLYPSYM